MINVVHLGIGPLGQKMVKYALERGCFNIVGAVDPAPDKAGRDLGELCGIEPLGIKVSTNLNDAIKGKSAEVALVTTVSSIVSLESQVVELAKAKLHVISTCEELFFPWNTQPEVSKRIDEVCRENGVVCLGTGVNPGYLMDFLPSVLTGVCQNVKSVKVWRVQDASIRRIPFQQKIGAGLTLQEFETKKKSGTLRHVGLPESVDFIAKRLGFNLDRNVETLEPVMADRDIDTGYKPISKGMSCGVQQIGRGFVGEREVITLTFRAAVGEPESYEQVQIDGIPPIHSRITGGVNGDIATCAITLNTVRSVLEASPGLKTMGDIPPIAYFKD
ncbi:MAG: dihydrodipicolinate reductase [Phycisphaerae bacterium]|nr:dihydrodipicolinate reductase [Phycisphaerae bacterium]NIP51225.1 dihydrodipicolinate reductase [Phycisphaerae bacterium]NIS50431.1 dihydrodipicolinate reductase [Phycisphaerae bacterium]NIU08166.1 dihydrodipicolinate reductase [Phycisphaerae bacterium]NIU54937.1 dihydrodipicolinate reductase [Phycisphaerae bacterium]